MLAFSRDLTKWKSIGRITATMSSRRLGVVRNKAWHLVSALALATASIVVIGVGEAAAVTPTPPDPPTGLSAAPTSGGATVSWTAPIVTGTDSLGATAIITGYNVYIGTAPAGESSTPSCQPTTTSCPLTGLSPGLTYWFDVTAVNNGPATSVASSESSFLVPQLLQSPLTISPTNSPFNGISYQLTLT